jgi:hypothetical protein
MSKRLHGNEPSLRNVEEMRAEKVLTCREARISAAFNWPRMAYSGK